MFYGMEGVAYNEQCCCQTYDNGDFLVRFWKWISSGTKSWPDDQGTMNRCTEAADMSMPPQCAHLGDDVESIGEIRIRLDGALCYHPWSISPTIQLLLHPMPAYIQVYI
jgi:hypothetical protein